MGRPSIYKDQIIEMRSQGKTYKEVKEKLGCNMSLISFYAPPSKKSKDGTKSYLSRYEIRERNREFIKSYLSTHPCVDCGITDIRVLEFDHIKGVKLGGVCQGIGQTWSLERIQEEIDKCEIRCCNCHMIVTRERKKY